MPKIAIVTKEVSTIVEEVDVTFPLYYQNSYVHDRSATNTVGRIEEDGTHVAITQYEDIGDPDDGWEISVGRIDLRTELADYLDEATPDALETWVARRAEVLKLAGGAI